MSGLNSSVSETPPGSPSGTKIEKLVGINSATMDKATNFYVKWHGKSYRACTWVPMVFVEADKALFLRFRRWVKYEGLFQESFVPGVFVPEFVRFDESYVTPELVIDENGDGEYLVKWQALSVTESTWECEVPRKLVDEYHDRMRNPIKACDEVAYKRDLDAWTPYSMSPQFPNGGELKDYQVEGLNWLLDCWLREKNSMLADEMGLGKTIQVLALLEVLRRDFGVKGPFMICAPLSTMGNWEMEIKKWTTLRYVSVAGSEVERNFIKDHLIFKRDKKGKVNKKYMIVDVVLLTYEMLSVEKQLLTQFEFAYGVFDEAHRLKNDTAKVYLSACRIHFNHIVLLTGTPIQNNVSELWALMHFIQPIEFSDQNEFVREFGDIQDHDKLEALQKLIAPFLLRRKKADVEISIAPKEETIIEVELTQIQRTLYRSLLDDNREVLIANLTAKRQSFNVLMMEARKVCNHPYLIRGMEDVCMENYKRLAEVEGKTPTGAELEYGSLVRASGKMILIDKLLPKLKQDGHKVLIFSQMTTMLDILEDYLRYMNYRYERLDGQTSLIDRKLSMERFADEEDAFCFLLSTRAGGLGINLTSADTVVIYDSDWNPQNDIQAQARCHRIGQTKDVKVYRLITRSTYEAEMFQRISKKLALDYALIDGNGGNQEGEELSAEDIDMILKRGAYYTFTEECTEADKFCEEDIDMILENRSSTGVRDYVSGGNSLFRKAAFKGSDAQDAMADPDFWTKILPPQAQPGKQRRRCVRKYSDYDDADDEVTEAQIKQTKKVIKNYGFMGVLKNKGNHLIARCIIKHIYKACKDTVLKEVCKKYVSAISHSCVMQTELRKTMQNTIWEDSLDTSPPAIERFLKAAHMADLIYMALAELSQGSIKDDEELIAFTGCPDGWSPYTDFSLLLLAYKEGVGKGILGGLTQEQLNSTFGIYAPLQWLRIRVKLLAYTYGSNVPLDYYSNPRRVITLDEFKKRHPKLGSDIDVIPLYRQQIFLKCCCMQGLYYACGRLHLAYTRKAFGMTMYSMQSFHDLVVGVLKACAKWQAGLAPSMAKTTKVVTEYKFEWLPAQSMQTVALRLHTFSRLRKHPLVLPERKIPWSQAPDWWDSVCDDLLLSVVRQRGLYAMALIEIALVTRGVCDPSPQLEQRYIEELRTRTPEATSERLKFLTPRTVIERITSLLAVASKQ